jgi:hypothetical protein
MYMLPGWDDFLTIDWAKEYISPAFALEQIKTMLSEQGSAI